MRHAAEIDADAAAALNATIEEIDWEHFQAWLDDYVLTKPQAGCPPDLAPAPFYPANPATAEQEALYRQASEVGAELLRQGRVAAFTVAGGQGTRLGFDHPKGTYPISPVRDASLFQWFAESLLRHGEIHGCSIPWYIMTSEANDRETRDFFAAHDFFGMTADQVVLFPQGMMPSFSFDGKLLMTAKDRLARSPDGHGGSLKALHRSGALDDMRRRGVEHISYFQVDNPLVSVVDPLFLGLHAIDASQMSSRCLPKNDPFERIGAFCTSADKLLVIEYSDLPDELATQTDAEGNLRFLAGSPAIHILRRDFVEQLNRAGFQLPFHRAEKKIACLDADGRPYEPTEANGVKLETFVFDALPLAETTLILEAIREREFAPTKNPTGIDSVQSCRELLQEEFARWLHHRGVDLPRTPEGKLDCRIEVSPRRYVTESDFQNADLGVYSFDPGTKVLIA